MGYCGEYCDEIAKRIFLPQLEMCRYFPKYFTIETCNNCNAHCVMCPKGRKGTDNLQVMEDELFDSIVSALTSHADWIEMICLNSDGEPLLDKKISERIRSLKDIGIKHINISTNGQLLTEENIYKLLESGLDDIRVSIDGFTKDTFESVRCGLNYETVLENTKNLIRMRNAANKKMSIRIRMVELEENRNERKEWMVYWQSLVDKNIDRVQVMPMHTWSGKVMNELDENVNYYRDKPCVSVFSSFTINYDGKVQLCDSDIEQEILMGNLRSQTIEEIWQSERFEEIRQWHANGQRNRIKICKGCNHWSREFKEDLE